MAAKTEESLVVGRRLRELREERGIPKELVALKLSMSAENVRHYESGRNQLAVTMLPTLAGIYGMTVAELVSKLLVDRATSDTLQSSDTGSHNNRTANYDYTKSRQAASAGQLTVEYAMANGLHLRHITTGHRVAAGVA